MFPPMRQRLLITGAVVLGALVWVWAGQFLRASDGGSGFSLTTAQSGPIVATAVVAALGIPALVMGLVISAQGHLLSGVFVVAASLCVVAGRGGAIDGWLWHAAEADALPERFSYLITELTVWQAGVVVMLAVIQRLRSPMRSRFPALAFDDHLGVDTTIRFPQLNALASGLVCAVVAGVLCLVLIRDSDGGQVICGLGLSFTIGAMVGQLIFAHTNPVGILFSPAVVAVAAYTWVLMKYDTTEQVLAAWYHGQLPGPALGLPIHYASAAIVACTIGVGWAQVLQGSAKVRQNHEGAVVQAADGLKGFRAYRQLHKKQPRRDRDRQ